MADDAKDQIVQSAIFDAKLAGCTCEPKVKIGDDEHPIARHLDEHDALRPVTVVHSDDCPLAGR